MSEPEFARVVIIGGGPAGYTATIYAARAGLTPVCVEGYESGGQIVRSVGIDNFPGFPDGISGIDLADRMRAQALRFGARVVMNEVIDVDLSRRPFTIRTSDTEYAAAAVIVATGATPRQLGLAGESEYTGRGVCYCAICDGPIFAGKRVAVVGGGDAAVGEAVALAEIAERVTLVHRRDEFRAGAAAQRALRATPNITVCTPHVVTEIVGTPELGLTGIRFQHVDTCVDQEIPIDGLFISVGHIPASGLFTRWLDADEYGFLLTRPESTATNVPGVFVAGDVGDHRYRQAVTASSSGACAAIDAERWLAGRDIETNHSISVRDKEHQCL